MTTGRERLPARPLAAARSDQRGTEGPDVDAQALVLGWQRSAGNRGVQRLLDAGRSERVGRAGTQSPPPVVQRKLHLDGPRTGELVEILTMYLGPAYVAAKDADNHLVIRQVSNAPVSAGTRELVRILEMVIADPAVVSIQFVANARQITIGNWEPAAIDLADVMKFDTNQAEMGPDVRSILAHEIAEQFERQARHVSDFSTAHHGGGVPAEDRVTGANRVVDEKRAAVVHEDGTRSFVQHLEFVYPSGRRVGVDITIDHNKVTEVEREVMPTAPAVVADDRDRQADDDLRSWLSRIGPGRTTVAAAPSSAPGSTDEGEFDMFGDAPDVAPSAQPHTGGGAMGPAPAVSPLAAYTSGVFTPEALAQHFPAPMIAAIHAGQAGPFTDRYGGRWRLTVSSLPHQVMLARVP